MNSTENSDDFVSRYQVKTDTQRLGSSNKMQTNKLIITYKAEHVSPHQTSRSPCILETLFFVHLKMCTLSPRNNRKITSDEMTMCVDVPFCLGCHLRIKQKGRLFTSMFLSGTLVTVVTNPGRELVFFRGSACASFIMSVCSKHDRFHVSNVASHLFLMIL